VAAADYCNSASSVPIEHLGAAPDAAVKQAGSLHAKSVVQDRTRAIVGALIPEHLL
jgi:hypothetical protein